MKYKLKITKGKEHFLLNIKPWINWKLLFQYLIKNRIFTKQSNLLKTFLLISLQYYIQVYIFSNLKIFEIIRFIFLHLTLVFAC